MLHTIESILPGEIFILHSFFFSSLRPLIPGEGEDCFTQIDSNICHCCWNEITRRYIYLLLPVFLFFLQWLTRHTWLRLVCADTIKHSSLGMTMDSSDSHRKCLLLPRPHCPGVDESSSSSCYLIVSSTCYCYCIICFTSNLRLHVFPVKTNWITCSKQVTWGEVPCQQWIGGQMSTGRETQRKEKRKKLTKRVHRVSHCCNQLNVQCNLLFTEPVQ